MRILYGGRVLYDPDAGVELLDVELVRSLRSASELSFKMPATHECAGVIELESVEPEIEAWEGARCLMRGRAYSCEDVDDVGTVEYRCEGELAYLNDTSVRPYSTVVGEAPLLAPSDPYGYFAWLVDNHNAKVEPAKQFRVGVNQGHLLDDNEHILRSDSDYPSTGLVVREKLLESLGGFVRARYVDGARYVDYLADTDGAASQRIEFGANLLKFARTRDGSPICSAVIPLGSKPEGSEDRITIAPLGNGDADAYGRYEKRGDAVVSVDLVSKVGYRERAVVWDDVTDPAHLVDRALSWLPGQANEIETLNVKAYDLSRIDPRAQPIELGDYVRVTSAPHGYDSYMIVSRIVHRPTDRQGDEYVFGVEGDDIGDIVRKHAATLNAGINGAYEKAEAVDKIAKDAQERADAAQGSADKAQTDADAAKLAADAAKTAAAKAQTDATAAAGNAAAAQTAADAAAANLAAAEANLDAVSIRVGATEADVAAAELAVKNAKAAADAAAASASTAKTSAATAQATADAAKSAAAKAQSAADALGARVTSAETKIEQNAESIVLRATKTEVATAKSEAVAAAAADAKTKADKAKSSAVAAAATDAKTKADAALAGAKTYADAQIKVQADRITSSAAATDALGARVSTVEQTASGLSVSLESVEATANSASATANAARTEAASAAKTASDYMQYTADGLEVGNRSSGAWSGFRSRMAAGAFEVLDAAGNVVARYGAKEIELGMGMLDAVIRMCGGKGAIAYYAGTDQLVVMAPGSIALAACQTLSDGTVQPYDSGVSCNRSGVLLKGAVEASGTFRLNGGNMADFVVAQGTSGIWRWRKWASGFAECWGVTSFAVATGTDNWHWLGYDTTVRGGHALPFAFTAIVDSTVTLVNGNYWAIVRNENQNNLSQAPQFWVVAPSAHQATVTVRYGIAGTWR